MTLRIPSSPADQDAIGELLRHCYALPPSRMAAVFAEVGMENFRLQDGPPGLLGVLSLLGGGQFFGGRSVPAEGWAGVGVPLEARGAGTAHLMLSAMLREERVRGIGVVPLYPSTQRLYRSLGFETAGASTVYRMSPAELPPGDRSLPVQRVEIAELESLAPLYRQAASRCPGWLDRAPVHWRRLQRPLEGEVLYAYLLGEPSAPEGYLVYAMKAEAGRFSVQLRDRVALSRRGLRRLWGLLGDLRSMVTLLRWRGPGQDPDTALFVEQRWEIESQERWMLRLVHLPIAMEARGYPMADGVLSIEVMDEVLPENAGRWRLVVEGGVGHLERGGEGGLRLGVGALATLYSGLFTASKLHELGLVEGDEGALYLADRLFAGPEPWMPDRF